MNCIGSPLFQRAWFIEEMRGLVTCPMLLNLVVLHAS